MNYSESEKVLDLVKKSKRIFLNCHNHPDPDSIGSATSMYEVLKYFGKEVFIYCPSEVMDEYKFIPNSDQINTSDYEHINFSEFDLIIVMDSSSWDRVSGIADLNPPEEIDIVNIDNHKTNTAFGSINILEPGVASTCEMLWKIYQDWNFEINSNMALSLLSGIYGDTGSFQYSETTAKTHEIAKDLIERGADHNKIVSNLYRSMKPEIISYMKVVLENYKIENNYVWFAINYEQYGSVGKPEDVDVIDFLLDGMNGSDFGFRIIEKEPRVAAISFRARVDAVDVSRFAAKLGGGGHQGAAGAKIEGDFEEVVDRVLKIVRNEIN